MSGLEVVAAMLALAEFGTKVANTLYDNSEQLVHARSEIRAIARSVSLSTSAIVHVHDAIEPRQASCSRRLFRDVRRVLKAFERTFTKIRDKLLAKKTAGSRFGLDRIRWLFKRKRAFELEARMESLKSTLLLLMSTVKLGDCGQRFAGVPWT